ncbi:MAG: D-alanyl-D-alanine carboxypeptidase/D-alanyl-D-alanine-endopeptidase [Bacteroidota bacterium]
MKSSVRTFSLLLFLLGCSAKETTVVETDPVRKLGQELSSLFDDPEFSNAYWGVMVQSMNTGEIVYARNEKKMFMPASNLKLFTASAALKELGPEYRYVTRLVTNGLIGGNTLYGDLIVIGSGDPTISGRFNDGKPTETFELWADSLKLHGITEIAGNIIGDDNCFDDEYYGAGWSSGYETDYYAAQISGLSFNDNCIDFSITSSPDGKSLYTVSWSPATAYVNVINQTKLADANDSTAEITFSRVRGTNTIFVRGSLPLGKSEYKESVTVENPTLFTVSVFKEVLESKGIKVNGRPVDGDEIQDMLRYDHALHLASFTSAPNSVIIGVINKSSQNLYSENVFRTLGWEKFGLGSAENGRTVSFPLFACWGVDTSKMRMVDGSGLSRKDLVTPSDVVSVLTGMYNDDNFQAFYESLPIAGIDGSLKNRMRGTRGEGNVHAKTGMVDYVRTLSGFVTSRDGEMFAFSMMANHYTVETAKAEKIQNDACIKLAEFQR